MLNLYAAGGFELAYGLKASVQQFLIWQNTDSFVRMAELRNIWAATWQNQQNECAPSEDSDQSGHPPNLIRVFTVRMKKAWVLSYPLSTLRRLRSDWADAQADLSLRLEHTHFVCFVMSWLICTIAINYHMPWDRLTKCLYLMRHWSPFNKFQVSKVKKQKGLGEMAKLRHGTRN